jgi:hypothetical protein
MESVAVALEVRGALDSDVLVAFRARVAYVVIVIQ